MSTNEAMVKVTNTMNAFKPKLAEALGKGCDVDQEISSVLATVANSAQLQLCSAKSIAMAAYTAATLKLPVNALGLAYLVPYKNNATLQIGYRGWIKLVSETGLVKSIDAYIVYEKDYFVWECGSAPRVSHKPCLLENPGKMIAVYAVAQLRNEAFKAVVMTRTQVDAIRAKSPSSDSGPWKGHYEEMAKKTVIKRLCKTLPLGINAMNNIAKADDIDTRSEEGRTYDVIDIEPPDIPASAPVQQSAPIAEQLDAITVEAEPIEEDVQPSAMSEQEQLICQLDDLQKRLKELNPKADSLPKGVEKFTVDQLKSWIVRKEQALKEIAK